MLQWSIGSRGLSEVFQKRDRERDVLSSESLTSLHHMFEMVAGSKVDDMQLRSNIYNHMCQRMKIYNDCLQCKYINEYDELALNRTYMYMYSVM